MIRISPPVAESKHTQGAILKRNHPPFPWVCGTPFTTRPCARLPSRAIPGTPRRRGLRAGIATISAKDSLSSGTDIDTGGRLAPSGRGLAVSLKLSGRGQIFEISLVENALSVGGASLAGVFRSFLEACPSDAIIDVRPSRPATLRLQASRSAASCRDYRRRSLADSAVRSYCMRI